MKFCIEKFIQLDIDKIFSVISNQQNFKILLPETFSSIKLMSSRNKVCITEEHIRIFGNEKIITAKYIIDYPLSRKMFILGGDGKGSSIIEEYTKDKNRTKLILSINLKFNKFKFLKFFQKNKIYNEILYTVERLIKELEKPKTTFYL
ncbi:MAG: polyketide cyclase [Thaumarchaeota archaeon]|nr:polyketide cyclase [Nitrososphaerota archaeon]MCY3975571.1 polyketide cyclase [Nitrososphaerota archaeon]